MGKINTVTEIMLTIPVLEDVIHIVSHSHT